MAIQFKVGFIADTKDLEKSLESVSNEINNAFTMKGNLNKQLTQATQQAMVLKDALSKATTQDGSISYSKMAMQLNNAGTSASKMVTTLASGGQAFQGSLNAANLALATSNRQAITLGKTMKEVSRVMVQSFKFTAAQTIIREISSDVQQAVRWIKELDSSINDIAVVTGKSAEDVTKITEQVIKGSKELKVAAKDYAEGALIFYQQGLSDEEVTRRNEITIKASKAANQSIQEMSKQLTAIWNTYGMVGEEQLRAASVGAALAANTAVDFKDIAEAMQSAAAPAAQMGVQYNELAAIIATVGDVTQQSASTIGNAYKTIFSRFQQLKAEGTDGEVTLSKVSAQLQNLGIEVLDQAGNLRELGDVINEVGESWDQWTQTQQTAIAQIVGGTRQYGQFLALMNNFDKYKANLQTAMSETGSTLEQQYTQAIDSIEHKAEIAAESWRRAFGGAFNTDSMKDFYDMSAKIADVVGNLIKGMGGLPGILTTISIALSNRIVPALITGAKNAQIMMQSLTPGGREKSIKNDYAQQNAALDKRYNAPDTSAAEKNSIAAQKEKLKLLEKIALKNEEINNKMRTATGEEKVILQMQQERLKTLIDTESTTIDRQMALSQELNIMKDINSVIMEQTMAEEASLQAEEAKLLAQQEILSEKMKTAEGAQVERYTNALSQVEDKLFEIELRLEAINKIRNSSKVQGPQGIVQQYKSLLQTINEVEAGLRSVGATEEEQAQMRDMLMSKVYNVANAFFNDYIHGIEGAYNAEGKLTEVGREVEATTKEWLKSIQAAQDTTGLAGALQVLTEILTNTRYINDEFSKMGQHTAELVSRRDTNNENVNPPEKTDNNGDRIKSAKVGAAELTGAFTQVGFAISGCITSGQILMDTLKDPDLSGIEKMTRVLGQLPMIIMSATQGFAGLKTIGTAVMSKLGVSALAAGGIMAGVAAGAVAIGYGIYKVWENWHNAQPEVKLEKARKAADDASQAFEKAKTEAASLFSQFDDYDNAVKKLEECKEGTIEWYQALTNVNSIVQDLLDKVPGLSQYLEVGENGELTINPEGIEFAKQQANDQVIGELGSKMAASRETKQLEIEVEKKDLQGAFSDALRDIMINTDYGTRDDFQNLNNYKNLYDDIESLIGKSKEEIINDVSDAAAKQYADQFYQQARSNALAVDSDISWDEWAAGEGKEIIDSIKTMMEDNLNEYGADIFQDLVEQASDYAAKVGETQVEIDSYNKQLTAQAALLEGITIDKDIQEGVQRAFGDIYDAALQTVRKEGNALEKYTEKRHLTEGNDYTKQSDGSIKLKDGTEVTQAQMEAAVALQLAAGELGNTVQKFDDLNRMTERNIQDRANGNQDVPYQFQSRGIRDVMVGDSLSDLNEHQINAMMGMDEDAIIAMLEKSFNVAGKEAVEAKLQEFGFDTIEAFKEGIDKAGGEAKEAAAHAADNLTATTKRLYDQVANNHSLTVDAKEALADNLKFVFDEFDANTAKGFADILDSMGDGADKFLSNIDEIDWDAVSPDQLREKLKEFGVQTNLSDDQLKNLIKSLKGLEDSSYEAAESYNALINKAMSGVKENNSIISDEDYHALQEAGIAMDMFFEDMGDGTHQLMADADAFKQMVHDVQMGKLQQSYEASQSRMDSLSRAGDWVDFVNKQESGSVTETGGMAYALQNAGLVSNSEFDRWRTEGGGWDDNADIAEEIRQAYAEAGMSAEKIEELTNESAVNAARVQEAMENADFAFEVESAGLDLEETTRYAERLKKTMLEGKDASKMSKDEMRLYSKAAQDAAIANQKLDRGIGNLKKNLKDYKKALTESNKGTAEWSEAMDSLKGDLADIVGFDDADLLSDSFAEATLDSDDLKKALEGDVEAIRRLQSAAAEDMMLNIQVNNELTDAEFESVMTQWNYLKTELANGVTAGNVNQEELVKSFNEMIKNGKMTKDQIEAALAGLHVSANVKTTYTTATEQVPIQAEEQWWEPNPAADQEVPIHDGDGNITGYYKKPAYIKKTKAWTSGYEDAEVSVPSYEIEGTTDEGGNTQAFVDAPPPKPSTGGSSFSDNPTTKSSGGGGSSKTPEHKAKKVGKYDSLKDRYSTIKAAIADTGRALEDYANAEDDAFGAAKLAAMTKQEQSLTRQAKQYSILRKEALKWLKYDQGQANSGISRKDLQQKLSTLGIGEQLIDVKFDDEGYVANRTEIINQLDRLLQGKYELYKAAADAFDAEMSTNETESERIDKMKEEYEGLKELVDAFIGDLDQVDETAEEARQALLDELEKIREWMQKKVDKANYKLELRLSISELDIKMMEMTMRLWDKLGVKIGKTFDTLHSKLKTQSEDLDYIVENSNRMWEILDNISQDSKHQSWFVGQFGEEAWNEYINGNGGLPDSVIQNLEDKANQMVDQLNSMFDTAEEMLGQFTQAMNMFLEDFDRIANKLSRQNEKLDMFEDLLDFSAKKYSVEGREAVMGILQARMDNAKVAVANAKAEREFTEVAVKEAKASLEQFYAQEGRDVNSYDDTAAFFYNNLKQTLSEAEDAAAEAESKFYSSMQDLTAAARAAIEESARIIEEELVDSLGGIFDSFDSGLDMYQHQDDINNFFLDDYDKGFELKKLLSEIDKAMEDVTDPERLSEWGSLVNDINAANADGVKITQTDLDILRARFDLQKAYDEYTDARAQKNTMRLTRDASGNYSYVYSGEESQNDDAQMQIEEALHNIHKMHREAADEMQSMWFQTYVEMEKYVASVDQLRLQTDEKYAQEVEWMKQMYQQKLEHYRDQTIQHNAAIDRSYEDTTLGIITGFNSMESTHEWYLEQAEKYDEKLKESAQSWEQQVRTTCQENGINYDSLEKTVKEDTDKMIQENKALREEINRLKTEGIRSLQQLGAQIRNFVSTGVSDLRRMIQTVQELINKLQELKRAKLAQAESEKNMPFDAGRDYTATMMNYAAKAKADAAARGEEWDWENDATFRALSDERYNKQVSDLMKGHGWYKDSNTYTRDEEWKLAEQLAKNTEALNENTKTVNETDKSQVSQNVGNQGSQFASDGYKTATGGLIKTPQIRSLAEEGPELVLNAEDTENILRAVSMVRQTVQAQIGANSMRQYAALQERVASVNSGIAVMDETYKAYLDAALAGQDQTVHIEANFPGVSVASEIEEAFNQLVTQAAQYRIRQDR